MVAALVLTTVLWASAFASIRVRLEDYGPEEVALSRFLVVCAVLAANAAIARMRLPEGRDLPADFLAGLLALTVYHVALNYRELTVSAGVASILINTVPVFTALLATTFLGERLRVLGWVGMGAGLIPVMAYLIACVLLGEVPTLLTVACAALMLAFFSSTPAAAGGRINAVLRSMQR